MASVYPYAIDTNVQLPLTTDSVTQVKAEVVNNLRSAILNIEIQLGIDPSREYATVRARLDAMTDLIDSLIGGGGGGGGNANLTSTPPVNVTKSPTQLGTLREAALSDHKHDISTASATSIGAVNSEGSSTFLARADHTHAVVDLGIAGSIKGSILYYNGSNWVQLAPSTDGFTLTTHGSGNNPTWQAGGSVSLTTNAPVNVTKATAQVGVSNFAARDDHKHDVSTAAVLTIGNANTEGSATTIARSDHIHALGGTVGGDLSGTLPNPTVTGFHISGATQGAVLYYNGTAWVVLNPGNDGYVLTTHSTGNNPDWTSLPNGIALAVVAPIDVDKNPAVVGVSARAAHEDHKHSAATASAVTVGAANTEGSAITLARSDHTHLVNAFNITGQVQGDVLYFNGTSWVVLHPSTAGSVLTTNGTGANPSWTALPTAISLATVAPADVTKATAVIGTSPRAAREDHKHNITTASAVTIGAANAEGVATTLARSDHTHLVSAFNITGQVQGDVLYFDGTNWVVLHPSTDGLVLTTHGAGANPTWQASPSGVLLSTTPPADVDKTTALVGVGGTAARSDHKHNISTATAVTVGAANAEGTATSLARSDHTHLVSALNITGQVQGDILYFNGTAWVVLHPSTAGSVLTTNGAGANPSWAATAVLTTIAPLNVNANAAAVGTGTTAARNDHKHNIDTAIAVSIGNLNAIGVSTSLSRADHTHAVTDLSMAGEATGDIIYYNGTNWVVLHASTAGNILQTNGTGTAPTWVPIAASGITSVFGRTGPAVVAVAGDYNSTQITNVSSVTGATVTNALNTLLASDLLEFKNVTTFSGNKTFAIADVASLAKSTSTGAVTLTIPTNASVNIPTGSRITIMMSAKPSAFSILPASGVTLNIPPFEDLSYASVGRVYVFECIALNVWFVWNESPGTGDIENRSNINGGVGSVTDAFNTLYNYSNLEYKNVTSYSASRSLTLADAQSLLICTASSGVILTIPTNASVAFVVGTRVSVTASTASLSNTIVPASGVTFVSNGYTLSPTAAIADRLWVFDHIDVNTWLVSSVAVYASEIADAQPGGGPSFNGGGPTVRNSLNTLYNNDLLEYKAVTLFTASRTLALTDAGTLLVLNATGGGIVLTVPTNASVPFPIGTRVSFSSNVFNNTFTISAASGVTFNTNGFMVFSYASQSNRVFTLDYVALNTWIITSGALYALEIEDASPSGGPSFVGGGPTVKDSLSTLYNRDLLEYKNTFSLTGNQTLVLNHQGGVIILGGGGSATVTIPANASVAFPIGTRVTIINISATVLNIVGAGGVTVSTNNYLTFNFHGLEREWNCDKIGTDTWYVSAGAVQSSELLDNSVLGTAGSTVTAALNYLASHSFVGSIYIPIIPQDYNSLAYAYPNPPSNTNTPMFFEGGSGDGWWLNEGAADMYYHIAPIPLNVTITSIQIGLIPNPFHTGLPASGNRPSLTVLNTVLAGPPMSIIAGPVQDPSTTLAQYNNFHTITANFSFSTAANTGSMVYIDVKSEVGTNALNQWVLAYILVTLS